MEKNQYSKVQNLDVVVNRLGFEIVSNIGKVEGKSEKEKLFNHIDKSLGVLNNDGVYAYYVFCQSKKNEEINEIFIKNIYKELKRFVGDKKSQEYKEKDIEEFFRNLSSDLDKLLFFRDMLEEVLTYARYHAKAQVRD